MRWSRAIKGLARLGEPPRVIAASERAGRAERVMATISVMAITCYRAMSDYNCPQIHEVYFFICSFFFNERLTTSHDAYSISLLEKLKIKTIMISCPKNKKRLNHEVKTLRYFTFFIVRK